MNSSNAKSVTVKAKWTSNCATGTTQVNVNLAINGAQDFDYINNSIRCAILQKEGYYKLEVWGASGGGSFNTSYISGYGGYSYGSVYLDKVTSIYVVVGGTGAFYNQPYYSRVQGGYNGGGVSGTEAAGSYAGGGGGATHIATVSGLLKDLSAYKNTGGTNISKEILIVAGGGGGVTYSNGDNHGHGGSGGGMNGASPYGYGAHNTIYSGRTSTGATQTAGGVDNAGKSAGGFGYGGNPELANWNYSSGTPISNCGRTSSMCYGSGGGGGAGWYGGGGTGYAGGSGGSGYIANTNLINKRMYQHSTGCTQSTNTSTYTICTSSTGHAVANAANAGNGYARITYLGTSL